MATPRQRRWWPTGPHPSTSTSSGARACTPSGRSGPTSGTPGPRSCTRTWATPTCWGASPPARWGSPRCARCTRTQWSLPVRSRHPPRRQGLLRAGHRGLRQRAPGVSASWVGRRAPGRHHPQRHRPRRRAGRRRRRPRRAGPRARRPGGGDGVRAAPGEGARRGHRRDRATALAGFPTSGSSSRARATCASQLAERAARLDGAVVLAGLRPDVMRVFDAADMCLHPSAREALPTTLMEALAASVPVVATDVGGIPEIVTDGAEGLLVPAPPEPDAVAGALAQLLGDAALRRTMGASGRRAYEARFTAEPWLGAHAALRRDPGRARRPAAQRTAEPTAGRDLARPRLTGRRAATVIALAGSSRMRRATPSRTGRARAAPTGAHRRRR